MKIYKPGYPIRSSKSGRPIMVLLELIGQPWTLRILWELREDVLKFAPLRTACENISPTSLNKRLAELRGAKIVEHKNNEGYRLTNRGKQLMKTIAPLNQFVEKWAEDFKDNDE